MPSKYAVMRGDLRRQGVRWKLARAMYGTIVNKEFKDNVNVNNDQMYILLSFNFDFNAFSFSFQTSKAYKREEREKNDGNSSS
jgi:hypothetical protein